MENTEINWNEPQQVRQDIQDFVSDLKDEYQYEKTDNPQLDEHDFIFESIDNSEYCFVNYKAEKVARAFDLDPFGVSEWSGDRYNSWNQMAFMAIYNEYFNQ